MREKEIKVILLGCLAKRTDEEQSDFENLILNEELDWGFIGGVLVHHRLSGYFYYGLGGLRNHLTLEFMKTLRDILLYKIVDVVNTFRIMTDEEISDCVNKAKDYNVVNQLEWEHLKIMKK